MADGSSKIFWILPPNPHLPLSQLRTYTHVSCYLYLSSKHISQAYSSGSQLVGRNPLTNLYLQKIFTLRPTTASKLQLSSRNEIIWLGVHHNTRNSINRSNIRKAEDHCSVEWNWRLFMFKRPVFLFKRQACEYKANAIYNESGCRK